MQAFEKLGAFYLGRLYDPISRSPRPEPLLYDAKDLTTHAVCIGMTGSGKTGLGLCLLEEAALDGIPAIAIDPKGDLGNLLLTFPELAPSDFLPWIDRREAERAGRTPEEHAAAVARRWREGLAEWGQDGARIARMREAVELALYTPGSSAGRRLGLLRSVAPPAALGGDADALREHVSAAASALLALVGIAADPLHSREHILLATLVERAWGERRAADLPGLIREIQKVPFERIGVLDVESFFPARERLELAMRLNNLLASPGFALWTEGDPLDVQRLLWTPAGRPRVVILSIAHLSEVERMFFVTLLLNEVVAWMRNQPGTGSLRAMLYMDEVFGYFPPIAEPPAKRPMLTLLKQARAYGLGVVLATQNPVDLDYRGLANAGTWFLGRLQTERDKARVLEGLESAAAAAGRGLDRARLGKLLSGLDSRVFLLNNVHEDEPVVFQTRWALSYLSGPLTRPQLALLGAATGGGQAAAAADTPVEPQVAAASAATPAARAPTATRPVVAAEVTERFAPVPADAVYRPSLLARVALHYTRRSFDLDVWHEIVLTAPVPGDSRDPWEEARRLDEPPRLVAAPDPGAGFAELPAPAQRAASWAAWSRALAGYAHRSERLTLFRSSEPHAVSSANEAEGDFRARLVHLAREGRDRRMAKVQASYEPKLARLEAAIRRAEARVEREEEQYGQRKLDTALSVGATVLGALIGRRLRSAGTLGRATSAARGAGRAARERGDVARALQELEARRSEIAELEAAFEAEATTLRIDLDPRSFALEAVAIPPAKADIAVREIVLAWR